MEQVDKANKMVYFDLAVSVIALNVSGLSISIWNRKCKIAGGKNQDPQICAVYKKPTLNMKAELSWKYKEDQRYTLQTLIQRNLKWLW